MCYIIFDFGFLVVKVSVEKCKVVISFRISQLKWVLIGANLNSLKYFKIGAFDLIKNWLLLRLLKSWDSSRKIFWKTVSFLLVRMCTNVKIYYFFLLEFWSNIYKYKGIDKIFNLPQTSRIINSRNLKKLLKSIRFKPNCKEDQNSRQKSIKRIWF